jgi:indolepyruvate ferredoxin oxidoreductase alpha subunit
MKGVDVAAEALRRAADRFYTVPGYPVSDLAARLEAATVINEKVALEYALGDSLAGRRAAVIIKNVGLNCCADPLVNATTQGVKAGVILVVGDDIEVRASQNAQDSRYYGPAAQVPVIEPGGGTMGAAMELAFQASEMHSRAALVRVTPPALDGPAREQYLHRGNHTGSIAGRELTMKGRTQAADQRTHALFAWSRASSLNRFRGGVVGVGAAEGDSRVVTAYPPPADPDMLSRTRELGRPFVWEHRFSAPPECTGTPETMEMRGYHRTFCRDCPFIPLLEAMQRRGLEVVCDIGCSLLALNPPYSVGVAAYGLGSSIGVAAKSGHAALTGDYALLHSGINALIDVYENCIPLLCIVLKNERMGMVGDQRTPDVLRYLGFASPIVIDAADIEHNQDILTAPGAPTTVVVTGTCPPGGIHETVEC